MSATLGASCTLKIAVTGGAGALAAHLLRALDARQDIAEVRTIDRKPFRPLLGGPTLSVPHVHHCCDLLDAARLQKALEGVDVVFHLARKSLDFVYVQDQRALNERYSRDNLKATECLLDAIFRCSVPRMIHIGDAYANLPPGDNFGTSEAIHCGVPSRLLLGHYGWTRARAELCGRERSGTQLPNGDTFHALFLRPTFVYGEAVSAKLVRALQKVGQSHDGTLSDVAGQSNGMLQYIYAGSLAAIMCESMELMLSERAQNLSGDFFYCMDNTLCTKFGEFCAPFAHALGLQMGQSRNHWLALLKQYSIETLSWLTGREVGRPNFSWPALQMLFGQALGFSNRKMALIMAYRTPKGKEEEWLRRTVDWLREEMGKERATEESNNNNKPKENGLRRMG